MDRIDEFPALTPAPPRYRGRRHGSQSGEPRGYAPVGGISAHHGDRTPRDGPGRARYRGAGQYAARGGPRKAPGTPWDRLEALDLPGDGPPPANGLAEPLGADGDTGGRLDAGPAAARDRLLRRRALLVQNHSLMQSMDRDPRVPSGGRRRAGTGWAATAGLSPREACRVLRREWRALRAARSAVAKPSAPAGRQAGGTCDE